MKLLSHTECYIRYVILMIRIQATELGVTALNLNFLRQHQQATMNLEISLETTIKIMNTCGNLEKIVKVSSLARNLVQKSM